MPATGLTGASIGLSARAQPGGQPSHEDSAVAACGSQPLLGGALRNAAVRCFDAAHGLNRSDDDAGCRFTLRRRACPALALEQRKPERPQFVHDRHGGYEQHQKFE